MNAALSLATSKLNYLQDQQKEATNISSQLDQGDFDKLQADLKLAEALIGKLEAEKEAIEQRYRE